MTQNQPIPSRRSTKIPNVQSATIGRSNDLLVMKPHPHVLTACKMGNNLKPASTGGPITSSYPD